ncbi:flagellar basal body-associated FliL family protein [Caldithrix abyssi]|nr:flagellar basal body-associated FliL family protein [Caldithrix abyssi]
MPEEKVEKQTDSRQKDRNEDSKEKTRKGFPKWMKWGLIVLSVNIVSAGAFVLTKFVIMPKYQTYKVAKQLEESEAEKNKMPEMGFVYYFTDFTVNPLGSNGRRFVVVEYAVESKDKKVIDEIKKREPQLRDEFITYLKQHTVDHILSMSFQEKSKSELIQTINNHLNTGVIDSLYYTKLIIQ